MIRQHVTLVHPGIKGIFRAIYLVMFFES